MRQAFVHEAVLLMDPDADVWAPGAAVTAALCGDWDHRPPCPLAPHHSGAERIGPEVHVRTLFAAELDAERTVRQRIDGALAMGQLRQPDAMATTWRLVRAHAGALLTTDEEHAERLIRS